MEYMTIKDIERKVKRCEWRIEVIKGWQYDHAPGTPSYLNCARMILDEEAERDRWQAILEVQQRAESRVRNRHATRARAGRKRSRKGKGGK